MARAWAGDRARPPHGHRQTRRDLLRRALFWLPALLLSCGGQTCNGCNGPLPPPQTPAVLLTPEAVQARVTQHGFDLIAGHLVQILKAVLGSGPGGAAVIDVGKLLGPQPLQFSGGLGIFNGKAGARDLVLTFDLKSAAVQLVEGSSPARVRMSFDHAKIGVQKGVVFGSVSVAGFDSDAACHLQNGLGAGSPQPYLATFSGTIDLVLGVDAAGKLAIEVQVSKPVLHEVGFALGKDCGLNECTDQFLLEDPCLECELCNTGKLASDAANAIKDLLGPLLSQLMEIAGNLIVKQLLAAGLNGKPLDIEIPVDLQAILAGASPLLGGLVGVPNGPLRLRTKPSPLAFRVQQGALESRFDAAIFNAAAACVVEPGLDATAVFAQLPQAAAPPLPAAMASADSAGKVSDRPVDVALLVGNRAMQEAGWSLLRSGLLCVALDSRGLYGLSGGQLFVSAGALDLALPGISQLADPAAPIRIAVQPRARPQDAPFVQLHQDATATVATLHISALGVNVQAFVRGRWLTLVELQADADLAAAITVSGQQLGLAVRDLAIGKVQVVGDPVAPGANWQQLAPTVAQLAVALLLSQPLHFDIDVAAAIQSLVKLPIAADLVGVQAAGGGDWLLVGVGLSEAKP